MSLACVCSLFFIAFLEVTESENQHHHIMKDKISIETAKMFKASASRSVEKFPSCENLGNRIQLKFCARVTFY